MDTQDSGQHRSVGASGWLLRVPRPTSVQGLVCTPTPGLGGHGALATSRVHVNTCKDRRREAATSHVSSHSAGRDGAGALHVGGRGPTRQRLGRGKRLRKAKQQRTRSNQSNCEAQSLHLKGRPWPGGETARRPASCRSRRKRLGAGRLEGSTLWAPPHDARQRAAGAAGTGGRHGG